MTLGLKGWVLFDCGEAPALVLLVMEQWCPAGLLHALRSVLGKLLTNLFFSLKVCFLSLA